MMHCSQLDYNKVTKIPFPFEHSGQEISGESGKSK